MTKLTFKAFEFVRVPEVTLREVVVGNYYADTDSLDNSTTILKCVSINELSVFFKLIAGHSLYLSQDDGYIPFSLAFPNALWYQVKPKDNIQI